MSGLQDIPTFLRDTAVGNLLLFLIVVTPLFAGLYKKLFLGPKLQVSLASIVSGNIPRAGGNPPTQRIKSQALLLRSKRGPIHNCKAKLVIDKLAYYMLWDTHRDVVSMSQPRSLTRDLLPEEDVQLPVWDALKNSDGEWFNLNKGTDSFGEFTQLANSVTLEITFLSEEGVLNKKPFRYKITGKSWDTVGMSIC